ncbi:MAG: DUF58 domain-containing protein [Actinomycetaceae bacterium]|nr:DUF58 domain-containing protein [Actinomycetaceae bacterium]
MSSPYLVEKHSRREAASAALREIGALAARWGARMRSWLDRVPLLRHVPGALGTITGFGWVALILAIAGWSVGRTRNWMELIVLSVFLAIVFLLAIAWVIGSTRYRVSLDLASGRVTVGEAAVGELRVVNEATRPSPAALIEIPVGEATTQFPVPTLGSGAEHSEIFTIPTSRRGVITVGPVRSVRGDGLGLLRREQEWVEAQDLYIHPRTAPVSSLAVGFIQDIEGATTQDLSSSDIAFHALRDYVPGDDRRSVHWKTTARMGRLMVRQFEETRRAQVLVLFDDDALSWADDDEYELGVSVAASVSTAVIRERRELSFVSQLGMLPAQSAARLLDAMTRLEAQQGLAPVRELAASAADRVPNASVVVLVTGSQLSVSELHRAYRRVPINARCLALRVDTGATSERRNVSGLTIVTIADLESLGLAVRKAVEA